MSELFQDDVVLMGPTKYFERGSPLEMLLEFEANGYSHIFLSFFLSNLRISYFCSILNRHKKGIISLNKD
jgi:hypothetical protein